MGVATHLGIRLREYDHRIRTFIPDYEEMLDAAAAIASRSGVRTIVDLGVGTGALAGRCQRLAPAARVVGIDADPDILALAAERLGRRASLVVGDFSWIGLPRNDAVVASFSLHHLSTLARRRRLFARIRQSLRSGGHFVSADCYPARDRALARTERRQWYDHVRASYTGARTKALFDAWSGEDVYVALETEIETLSRCGFVASVAWRKGEFAVVTARKRASGSART